MRRLTITILSLLTSICLFGQPKEVTLVVVGEGATKEEATNKALRSAVEQAYGVFVSANTEILNDELVRDEIATISSGNVKSFKELSYVESNLGEKSITLQAVVSVGKLIEYSKSHGSLAEFAGAVFAANLKLQEMNRRNEELSIFDYMELYTNNVKDLFDAQIEVYASPVRRTARVYKYGSPYENRWKNGIGIGLDERRPLALCGLEFDARSGQEESNYSLPIKIIYSATKLLRSLNEGLSNLLGEVSLSENELKEYRERNEPVYQYSLFGNDFFFRSPISPVYLNTVYACHNKALEKAIKMIGSSSTITYRLRSSYEGFLGGYCGTNSLNISSPPAQVLLSVFNGKEVYNPFIDHVIHEGSLLYYDYDESIWRLRERANTGILNDELIMDEIGEHEQKQIRKLFNSIDLYLAEQLGEGEKPIWEKRYLPTYVGNSSTQFRVDQVDFERDYKPVSRFRPVLVPFYTFTLVPDDTSRPIEIVWAKDDGNAGIREKKMNDDFDRFYITSGNHFEFTFYLPVEQNILNQLTSIEIE